ncbi:chemotaxis protein CheD [Bdellovibrio bacteriovorus]|uniref:chemotaxis protein CheD n=1 Tax=Bdellovibrio bacteriovorus TaxID=959 RepID=UPI0035A59134
MEKVEHHVRIGQLLIVEDGTVLKTVLGSCVGIALLWKKRGKCALAHCLLPLADSFKADADARYVDQTIPRMIERLGATSADFPDLEAVVAGGGKMISVEKAYSKYVVGDENLRVARQMLESRGIRIVAFVPGGEQGTKLRVDASSGEYHIESIPRAA